MFIENISVEEGKTSVILTLCESQDLSFLALHFLGKHEIVYLKINVSLDMNSNYVVSACLKKGKEAHEGSGAQDL